MYSLVGMADVNVNRGISQEDSMHEAGFGTGEAALPASAVNKTGGTEVRNRHTRTGNSTQTETRGLQQQLQEQEQEEQESKNLINFFLL